MTDRPRALAILIGVFLFGCIAGAASSYVWMRNRPSDEVRAVRNFPGGFSRGRQRMPDLKLTPEQESKFRDIMSESRNQLGPLWEEEERFRKIQIPKIEAIRAETNRKMMSVLDDNQKKMFSDFLNEMEKMRMRMPHGGRGSMGPPPPEQGPPPEAK